MTLTLVLPMPDNLANARMHWRGKNRRKLAYWERCNARLWLRQIPTPPAVPLSPVVIRPTLYLWATMDDDNALARVKWAADWLTRAGYIVDDKRPHCRFEIPEQHIDRKHQRLELTLAAA